MDTSLSLKRSASDIVDAIMVTREMIFVDDEKGRSIQSFHNAMTGLGHSSTYNFQTYTATKLNFTNTCKK